MTLSKTAKAGTLQNSQANISQQVITSYHYIFIIGLLWLTSHPRSTVDVVLLDTGTHGTSREIFSEDADDETRTRNPSVMNRVL